MMRANVKSAFLVTERVNPQYLGRYQAHSGHVKRCHTLSVPPTRRECL